MIVYDAPMRGVIVVVIVAACSSSSPTPKSPPPKPERVVEKYAVDPPRPTLRLPRHFEPQQHEATLAIDPAKPTFTGTMTITGAMTARSNVIWLHGKDLVVKRATANGTPVTVTVHAKDDLLELRGAFAMGRLAITLDYEGKIATGGAREGVSRQEHAGDKYAISFFEPTSARRVFPCIDEPNVKTPWTLALQVPAEYVAVANTAATVTKAIDTTHKRVTFAPTPPLPSYLIAFGVGPFDVVDAGTSKSGVPVRVIVPRGTAARAKFAATAFVRSLDIVESLVGVPFPYPKLDLLAAPGYASAMEHAGLITDDISNVLFDANASWRERRLAVGTYGHEIAHEWFGDYVTPTWWDDLWLKEAIATWFEHKVTHAFEPKWNDDRSATTRRNIAFDADSVASARAIRQPIANVDDIQNAFDGVTYNKGAAIIGYVERHVGAAKLQKSMAAYLKLYAHRNASYDQFVEVLERETQLPLKRVFATFVEQPGTPIVEVKLACDGPPRLAITQQRYLLPGSNKAAPSKPWQLPMCFAFATDGVREQLCVVVGEGANLQLPAKSCPKWVMTNAGGLGYYYTAVSAADATVLREVAWPSLTPDERRVVFEDVRGQVMQGALPASALMAFVPKLLEAGDRFSLADALGDRLFDGFDTGGAGIPWQMNTLVPPDLEAPLGTWARKQFAPAARRRGLMATANDTLDDEILRRVLIRTAGMAGDVQIVRAARGLAPKYRDLPKATRELVLWLAVDSDPKFAAQIHKDMLVETDKAMRLVMMRALFAISDPKRAAKMLDLALDPKLAPDEVVYALFDAPMGAPRRNVDAWLRTNLTAFVARLPEDSGWMRPIVPHMFFDCDPARRDATAKLLHDGFKDVKVAQLAVTQKIEGIDQCIALRAKVLPSLREWLRTAR